MPNQELDDPLIKDVVMRSLYIWESPLEKTDENKILENYSKYILRKWLFIIVCIALIIVTIGYALTVGDYPIDFWDCYKVIWHHIMGDVPEELALQDSIIFSLRMPRIEVAILAGATLAVAGVVMQSTLMNPLADSYTTGVSSGASLGATLSVVLGFSIFNVSQYGTILNAFVFSLIPMLVIVGISRLKNASPTTMIMGGIAVMYLFNAFTTVFSLMADPWDLLGHLIFPS